MADKSIFTRKPVRVTVEREGEEPREITVAPVSMLHASEWTDAWLTVGQETPIKASVVLAIVHAGLPERDTDHPLACCCAGHEGIAQIIDSAGEVEVNTLFGAILEANRPKDQARPISASSDDSTSTRRFAGWSLLAWMSRRRSPSPSPPR